VSTQPPGGRGMTRLVAVMDTLRSPGGCPWDAQQTHETLVPFALEEAHELAEAIEAGDRTGMREELGDVLLQVVFHARLAQEHDEPWSIDDVAADLVDKLVRRHPHVFAGASADDLDATWEQLKQAEKGRTSVTEGVPLGQPALSLAAKLQKRGARIGVPLPAYDGVGGELWALVARCRDEGLDAEAELRRVARDYRDRLAGIEAELLADGTDAASLTAQDWSARWS
jgi:XTP/dITP diphosphohydrolase